MSESSVRNFPVRLSSTPQSDSSLDHGYQGSLIRNFLHVLFKHKWLVFWFFVGTSLTVISAVLFFTKPVYQVKTQLMLSLGRENISDVSIVTSGTVAPKFNSSMEEQLARSIELLTGRVPVERVVQMIGADKLYPDLRKPAAAWRTKFFEDKQPSEQDLVEAAVTRLLANIQAEAAGKSGLVNLTVKHGDPEMASNISNWLASLYIERHLGIFKSPKADSFLLQQFQNVKRKLRDAEEKLSAFKRRYNITGAVKDEQELAIKQQVTVRTALNDTRSQQNEVASRIAQLKLQLANTTEDPGNTTIFRDKLANLELQEGELALRLKAENPMLRAVREEIRLVRQKIAEQGAGKSYGNTSARDGSLFAQLQQELLRNEAEQKALRAREEGQSAKLGEAEARLAMLDQVAVEFSHLQQAQQAEEQNNKLYQTKFEESRISTAMDAEKIASVRVVEPPRIPRVPIDSKTWLKILAGILFGLLGGIALAFVAHAMSGRLETAEEVQRYLALPVLASVPQLNKA